MLFESCAYLPVRLRVHQGSEGNEAIKETLTVYTTTTAEEAGWHKYKKLKARRSASHL